LHRSHENWNAHPVGGGQERWVLHAERFLDGEHLAAEQKVQLARRHPLLKRGLLQERAESLSVSSVFEG
jgi:hypothetical protein